MASDDEVSFSVSLFDDGEDAQMVASPPRVLQKQLPTARLFGDAVHSPVSSPSAVPADDASQQGCLPQTRVITREVHAASPTALVEEDRVANGDILHPLDMNSSPSRAHRRKRPSGQHPAGREHVFQHHDMNLFSSPKSSPTYRTMDGRMVTSKNPFSPYTPDTDVMDEEQATLDNLSSSTLQAAPQFPLYLGTSSASKPRASAPPSEPFKISLQRRDRQIPSSFSWGHSTNRSRYPDTNDRYSFTGSPIQEIDLAEGMFEDPGVGSKVRKIHMEEDSTTNRSISRQALSVDTQTANSPKAHHDGISPTDVMSFPTPSTPTKATRPMRHTPLREVTARAPHMERHIVARKAYDDPEGTVPLASAKLLSRFREDFDIIGQLGNGSFGTVYKCLSRLDGCMYAVKAAKRKAKGVADRDRMLKEVYALAALSDQANTGAFHIVRYHQAWMEENRLYIQTELCSFTLCTEMQRGPLTEQRRYKLLREILLALEFIHRNDMVHLDIKPENIFVRNDRFKLGDFGLVSKATNNSDVEEGDSRYMSMELLSGDHTDLTKSDIFSLGATLYETCVDHALPMDGQEWQNLRAGTFQVSPKTPFAMEVMIREMMHPCLRRRPTPSDLLRRKELLSKEQKQLIAERHKVLEANMALALQARKLKKLTPPRPGGLTRSNTWNGGSGW